MTSLLDLTQPDWLEQCSDFIGILDLDGTIIDINKTIGPPKETVIGFTFLSFILPEFQERAQKTFETAIASKTNQVLCYDISHGGIQKKLTVTFIPIYNKETKTLDHIRFIATEPKIEDRSQDMFSGIIQILSTLNQESLSIKQLIDLMIKKLESSIPDLLCSVLKLNESATQLHVLSAPSLPAFYNDAIDGITIGEGVGSCGTAAATKKRVIVEDVMTHPFWEKFKPLAKKASLKACWSEPIIVSNGDVWGTLAMYYKEIKAPSETDYQLIHMISLILSNAVERRDSETILEKKIQDRAQALLESEACLKEAQRVGKMGSWEWKVQANTVTWSDELFNIYGVSQTTFDPTFEGFLSLVYPDDIIFVKDYLTTSLEKLTAMDFKHRIRRPIDNKIIHVHCLGEVTTDTEGLPIRMRGTAQDITDQKKYEVALKKSEERLNRAQQIACMGSWEWNIETNTVLWSDELYRLNNLDKFSFTPTEDALMSLVPPDEQEFVQETLVHSLKSGQPLDYIHRTVHPIDGQIRILHILGKVSQNTEGRATMIIGTAQDITEQHVLTEKLGQAKQDLEALLEKKSLLLHELHHRVKNNLQLISSLFNIKSHLLEKTHPELTAIFHPFQERIQALSLVHESLHKSDNDHISFNHYIQKLSDNLCKSYAFSQKNIQFSRKIPAPIYFDMDTTHALGLIVNEIFTNALQHAFPDKATGKIMIIVTKSATHFQLTITDNGIGLAEDFEFDSATTFGFNMISMLAIQLHATIQTKISQGTCFVISLPIDTINNKKESLHG